MAYATVEDIEERWRELSDEEKDRAKVLLDDAAVILDAELAARGLSSKGRTDKLRYVSYQMVRRAMGSAMDGDYASISRTAGSFTEQVTPSNPSGDMYLTKNERRLLGVTLKAGLIAQVGP